MELRQITLDDREWINELLKKSQFRGSEYTFANMFNWSRVYPMRIGRVEDFLIVRSSPASHYYLFPAGGGDLRVAIDAMTEVCRAEGTALGLYGASRAATEQMEALYPGRFHFKEVRDNFDYLYTREKLALLAGKKLHSKRNHIARFKENNPDWRYERLTADNLNDAWEMNLEWCRLNGCEDAQEHGLRKEACAVRSAFENFAAEQLVGGQLRADGKVIAFTFGSRASDDTFVVHVEKAFAEIQGAYPMINQQFVENELSDYAYINREDDTGAEGLRRAKESYRPDILLEKFNILERLDS